MAHLKLTRVTQSAKPADIERRWYVVDADGQVLGRLATRVATVLRGKHKPTYTPNIDTGDHVIVINASKVALTGGKDEKKVYRRHSGYPGGLKTIKYGQQAERQPERVIVDAVRGMLPHNRLGRAMMKKLHVYPGVEQPHAAQKPAPLELGSK